ncbi:MAG TPA: GNAT family N-acetyltransferase, partial [Candidatus Polarisedimenticolia bacterium]|nr:GNAT family N-acetyltransferase [Candidatus Polarisedimenticolia bacterium]
MVLRDATPAERDLVLTQTHALWSDGLELASYQEYVTTLLHSDWGGGGKENYRFLVLAEPDQGVVGALKLYRFRARVAGRKVFLGGLGAVFTPPALRRRGHAAAMLGQAHDIMRQRGDAGSLLFSEIGTSYYARHGYRPLPLAAYRFDVPRQARAPEGVRRMRKPELEIVMRIRESEDATAEFALLRDRAYWGYLLARASCPTL